MFLLINAEGFPSDKASPLSAALGPQTFHRLLQQSFPQAHVLPLGECVLVCIMLAGADITDTQSAEYEASPFYEPCYCH